MNQQFLFLAGTTDSARMGDIDILTEIQNGRSGMWLFRKHPPSVATKPRRRCLTILLNDQRKAENHDLRYFLIRQDGIEIELEEFPHDGEYGIGPKGGVICLRQPD